ncbi:MAG: Periplasmic dipeptide transport protein [bacterium]|nr:Periplasmic dipeptide transport protein [bacterium]
MKKILVLLVMAFYWLGCTADQPHSAGQVLRYGIPRAPTSLDPATTSGLIYYQIVFNIFETLIATDWQTGKFKPVLATSWQPDSAGLCWTFTLRQGVFFHDGSPLNAEAVKISFERQFDNHSPYFRLKETDAYGDLAFGMVKEIRVRNDSTVQFFLKYPYSAFLDNLATPNFASIVSPAALQTFGKNFRKHPSGTGPFQFVRWNADSQIVIKKSFGYWGKRAQLDSVIYQIIPGLDDKLQKLQQGKLEVISGISAASVGMLRESPGIDLANSDPAGTLFLGFNCQKYPFSQIDMRRAVAHALDKKSMVFSISRGLAMVARGPLPPMSSGYDTTLADLVYDPELAKALLQRAGYDTSVAIVIHSFAQTDTSRGEPMAQSIKAALAKIGLKVEIILHHDWQAYLQAAFVEGKSQLFVDGWTAYTRHPDHLLYALFHSQSQHNFFKYKNSEVDRLLEQARRTLNATEQRALYRRVQEILLAEAPAVFISHPRAVYAIRNRVKNFTVDPLTIPWLHDVTLEAEK